MKMVGKGPLTHWNEAHVTGVQPSSMNGVSHNLVKLFVLNENDLSCGDRYGSCRTASFHTTGACAKHFENREGITGLLSAQSQDCLGLCLGLPGHDPVHDPDLVANLLLFSIMDVHSFYVVSWKPCFERLQVASSSHILKLILSKFKVQTSNLLSKNGFSHGLKLGVAFPLLVFY